jgi:hypothetical protein
MPGSYPDPRLCVNEALQSLEEAYVANYNAPAAELIFRALKAVKQLQKSFDSSAPGWAENDPHEVDYANMAL